MGRLESILGDRIKLFGLSFGVGLTTDKLQKALVAELIRRRKKTRRGFIVPNSFIIKLSPEDCMRLSSARFMEDLYLLTEKNLIITDSFMDGQLSVRLEEDDSIKDGNFKISSHYEDEPAPESFYEEPDTIVLERTTFDVPLNLPPVREIAQLKVIRGIDEGAGVILGERKIYIGRRDKNELTLKDENVSRLHAFIEYSRHRHMIHDADSLNGLSVGGALTKEACLMTGDEITLGNTVLCYEVL